MSNEIYKEYVNKYFFGDCKNDSQLQELNGQYLILWDENEGSISGVDYLRRKGYGGYGFIKLTEVEFKYISRAPKTQMINGHKVVAPRYDMPESPCYMFYLDASESDGLKRCWSDSNESQYLFDNGWYSTKPDAIAYANAHRESK